MIVNKATIALIKKFEGFRASAYPDPATGGTPWTIGFGHTTSAGLPTVGPGLMITRADSEVILQNDLVKYADVVSAKVKVDLNSNQFGALVSFTYNVGPKNFNRSSVLKRVNAGRFDEVPARLMLWNKANGKVMKGLTRRRKAEGDLFLAVPTSIQSLPGGQDGAKKPFAWLSTLLSALTWLIKLIFNRKE